MLPKPIRRYRRTTILTVGLLAFLAGLALARFGVNCTGSWVIVALVLFVAGCRQRRVAAVAAVAMLGTLGGIWRGNAVMYQLRPFNELYGKKVVMRLTAREDAVYAKGSQLSFEAGSVTVLKPIAVQLPGRIKVSGYGEYMVYRGDIVEVEGKLYAVRGGRQGGLSFADVQVVSHYDTALERFRRRFAAGMQNALPEPLASFGLGLLVGQRTTIPDDISKQLSIVGLTHLVAVSGYNLTIIVDAVRRIAGRRSKYQNFMLCLALIALFLAITGLSASIVRAALVSSLSLLAWYYGRTIRPLLLIVLVAAITAYWNPLYLWGDIGWYLSFLAFFGVVIIAPLLTARLYGQRKPKLVSAVLLETVSAQIVTFPLIMYIFQQISLVSVVSNVLVVPLVPLAMLTSVVAGLVGICAPMVAGWFAWPGRILLTYMLDLVSLLARVPHAVAQSALTLGGLVFLFAVIVGLAVVLRLKVPDKSATITDIETNI